jgi:hypothetical protein
VLVCGQMSIARAAPSTSGPTVCFDLGEVATRSYASPGSKKRPVGRDAQKARVDQVARKLGAELAPDDVERIIDQAFYEPQMSGQELGLSMAAECLKRHAFSVALERTNVCFEVARYARDFVLGKSFTPLDRHLQAIDRIVTDPLERKLTRELAHEVYQSNVSLEGAHELAAKFYSRCLAPGGSRP